MNWIYKIVFFFIEFFSGYGLIILLSNNSDFLGFDMIFSFILFFILLISASIIGIAIPGFIYYKLFNKSSSFKRAIISSIIGLIIGISIVSILDSLGLNKSIPDLEIFKSYRILIPHLIAIIGFNIGLTIKSRNNINPKVKKN